MSAQALAVETLAQVQVQPVETEVQTAAQVEIKECPICLDDIIGLKNCVTTDCGHTFHCRCLLTNIAHNGFACPFCRAALADVAEDEEDEEDEDEEDDEDAPARYEDDTDDDEFSDDGDEEASRASDYDSEQDDLDGEIEYIENQIVQMKEDHVLRGFRWLFQPLNADLVVNLEAAAVAPVVTPVVPVTVTVAAEAEVVNLENTVLEADDSDADDINFPQFSSYP
jgi:hypothetical protein